MRGFRGSRAAQSYNSSHFGRQDYHSNAGSGQPGNSIHGNASQRPVLPDWVKTPETRAREAEEAKNPKLGVSPQAIAQPKAATPLKLVSSNPKPIVDGSPKRSQPQLKVASVKAAPSAPAKKPLKAAIKATAKAKVAQPKKAAKAKAAPKKTARAKTSTRKKAA